MSLRLRPQGAGRAAVGRALAAGGAPAPPCRARSPTLPARCRRNRRGFRLRSPRQPAPTARCSGSRGAAPRDRRGRAGGLETATPGGDAVDAQPLMTTEQVAARLGVSIVRIHHFVRIGRLPVTRPGYAYRYRPADVEAFAQIPRRTGIALGPGGGGAPRGNFNRLGGGRRRPGPYGRLHAIRRHLPPHSRRLFDVAIAAAVQHPRRNTPHLRHRARPRAIARVVLATRRAWAHPAHTAAEQHKNLVAALEPWLKPVPATASRETSPLPSPRRAREPGTGRVGRRPLSLPGVRSVRRPAAPADERGASDRRWSLAPSPNRFPVRLHERTAR